MLLKSAAKPINAGTSTERAIRDAGDSIAEMLNSLGGYMAERATDALGFRARAVTQLSGVLTPGIPASDTPFILVAEDLAPADTATLDPDDVLAHVTSGGGPQSHSAIIARSLGLPAVVAAPGVDELPDGTEVFVDGAAGNIIADPSEEQRAAARAWAETAATLAVFDGNGTTADGHLVPLLANVGGAKDAVAAAALGAEGVGLFRTEFCFLERDTEPSVEEQAAACKGVFDAFPGKKVVLRTLDAGADKPLPFLTDATEPNPALGVRGYFASIGTNDLTQYAMAADRQLGPLAQLNSPWQPAVLRLIQLTVAGAAEEGSGKPVGLCGEAAADPALAVVLVGLGVSTLSMTSRSLAAVGTVLKSVTLEQAQELARLALTAPDALDAKAWVRAKLPILEDLGL